MSNLSSNPLVRGERRCMVGIGPEGENTFAQYVRADWADAEIERLRWSLAEVKKEICAVTPDWARALRIIDEAAP